MNEFINILKNNWEIITAVIVFIISFILQLIKKKSINAIDSDIFYHSISAVLLAEAGDKKGEDKLHAAVEYVLSRLQAMYPKLDVAQYANYVSKVIETILSTPQKKGGNVDGK